jgi:excisionase family DNA binding protein
MQDKGYLLCTRAAQKVGVHKATLYRWVRDGHVKAVDFNGAYYVDWESVKSHLGQVAKIIELE